MTLPIFLVLSAATLVWAIAFLVRTYRLIVSSNYQGRNAHIAANAAAALTLLAVWVMAYVLVGVRL